MGNGICACSWPPFFFFSLISSIPCEDEDEYAFNGEGGLGLLFVEWQTDRQTDK